MIRVSALHLYPVKSCRGLAVAELELDVRGPAGDRRSMIVDADGRFLTQREHHRLALVSPTPTEGGLSFDAPHMPRLEVDLRGLSRKLDVAWWRFEGKAYDSGDPAAAWLTRFLGRPARLVCFDESVVRAASPAHAPEGSSAGRFTDGYPVLLTAEASLQDLNARMASPLPMDRFRPNVVVSGTGPFDEDSWQAVRIGDVRFQVAKPCERCVVTTVDQETAEATKEPLATLATYRKRDGHVHFGQNLVHLEPGTIRVGDRVRPGA